VFGLEPGNYSCAVLNSIGCGDRVDFVVPDLSVANYNLKNARVRIYPNPAIEIINISFDQKLNFQSSIYDLNGRLILQSQNINELNIKNINQGSYLLEIKDLNTGHKIIKKIVVLI